MADGDILLFQLFLAGLGITAVFLVCAQLGHYFGYRRGYLRTGYLLGLFAGPAGLLAAVLLQRRSSPLLALEHELYYGTDDSEGGNWLSANYHALLGIFMLAIAVQMLLAGFALAEGVGFFLIFAAVVLALAAYYFRHAQPPLAMLPPLHQHAEVGMQDLLEWMEARYHAARIRRRSNVLRIVQYVAFSAAFALALLAAFNLNQGEWVLSLGVGTMAAAVSFAALGVWARHACFRDRRYLEGLYFLLFPEHDYDASFPEPDEFEERVRWRYDRILRQTLGFSKTHAEHLAVRTEVLVENTRQSFFLRPLGAGVLLWLLFKSCHSAKLVSNVAKAVQNPEEMGVSEHWVTLAVIGGVVAVALVVRWLLRSKPEAWE